MRIVNPLAPSGAQLLMMISLERHICLYNGISTYVYTRSLSTNHTPKHAHSEAAARAGPELPPKQSNSNADAVATSRQQICSAGEGGPWKWSDSGRPLILLNDSWCRRFSTRISDAIESDCRPNAADTQASCSRKMCDEKNMKAFQLSVRTRSPKNV